MSENEPPATGEEVGERLGQGIGRALGVVFTIYASAVFVVLWPYIAVAAVSDATLPADTWAWLSGLDTIAAIVVWVATLPIGAFLWAWQADLEPLVMGLVMLGLVAWTAVAFSGLLRMAYRRLAQRAG